MLASNVSSHSSKFKSTFLCKECSLRIAFIHILTLDCAEVQFNMSAVSELQYYGLSRVYLCFSPPGMVRDAVVFLFRQGWAT